MSPRPRILQPAVTNSPCFFDTCGSWLFILWGHKRWSIHSQDLNHPKTLVSYCMDLNGFGGGQNMGESLASGRGSLGRAGACCARGCTRGCTRWGCSGAPTAAGMDHFWREIEDDLSMTTTDLGWFCYDFGCDFCILKPADSGWFCDICAIWSMTPPTCWAFHFDP